MGNSYSSNRQTSRHLEVRYPDDFMTTQGVVSTENPNDNNTSLNILKLIRRNIKTPVKRGVLLSFLLLSSIVLNTNAQSLNVSPAQLNFGIVTETTPDSLQVTISNSTGKTVTLTEYRFYTIYGTPAFSCNTAPMTISDGGSASLWIRFGPGHNIFHNSELFILNDGHQGALRVDLLGQGRYSKAYYAHTENLSEQVLKDTLNGILGRNTFNAGYVVARDSMFMSYDNERVNGAGAIVNTIECVYTGRKAVGYTDRTDCQTNYSFNTEHTFPQNFFNSLEPMRADLFHLFPTDDLANNARGSLPFGIVTNPTWTQGGSKGDNTAFEPRDAHKGRTARAMFYFVLRYQNYSNFLNSQENILRQWHEAFPPDASEKARGNRIAQLQLNRNPFIDYPQLADRISSLSSTSTGTVAAAFDLPEDTIDFGLVDASIPSVYTFWITNTGNAPMTCSNLNLNPSSLLSWTAGSGGPLTILPGEAAPVNIQLANGAPGPLTNATLTFNLSGTGLLAVRNIPILAHFSLTATQETEMDKAPGLFPNPASNRLCWMPQSGAGKSTLSIVDLEGRTVWQGPEPDGYCIDIEQLCNGIYFLQWRRPTGSLRQRWVKW